MDAHEVLGAFIFSLMLAYSDSLLPTGDDDGDYQVKTRETKSLYVCNAFYVLNLDSSTMINFPVFFGSLYCLSNFLKVIRRNLTANILLLPIL